MNSASLTLPPAMPEKPTPRPSDSKSKRYPDHSKIWGTVKPDPKNQNYALIYKRDRYWLIYYDKNWQTAQMDLHTDDPVVARFRRDDLYKKAHSLGRVARSKIQHYAQRILEDPSTNHGLKFMVYFGNRIVTCDTEAEARAKRAEIARELLAAERRIA